MTDPITINDLLIRIQNFEAALDTEADTFAGMTSWGFTAELMTDRRRVRAQWRILKRQIYEILDRVPREGEDNEADI